MIFLVLDTILDLSRLPLKLAPPTVLHALASILVLHAIIATFSFGDNFLKQFLIVDSDGSKEAF